MSSQASHRTSRNPHRAAERGFTLLELVIVLTLSSLLAVMIAGPLSSVLQTQAVFQDEVTAKEEINYALMRMGREIREGQWDPEADGCGAWTLEEEGRLLRDGDPFLVQDEGSHFRIKDLECEAEPLESLPEEPEEAEPLPEDTVDPELYLYELRITAGEGGQRDLETLVYDRSGSGDD